MILTIVGFSVLMALGNWQWERTKWKAGLLTQLEQAASAAPILLRSVPGSSGNPGRAMSELGKLRFRRVTVRGQFEHDREMHVWAPGAKAAWSVVTPLLLRKAVGSSDDASASGQASHVFVIRGVVPDDRKAASTRGAKLPSGQINVTGRVRIDQPNAWANAPDVTRNQWFTRDIKAMSAYQSGLSAGSDMTFAPFFIEAEEQMGGDLAPKPNPRALTLANKHLEYALTWWGLAATLLVVFGIFAWGRIKVPHQGAAPSKQGKA